VRINGLIRVMSSQLASAKVGIMMRCLRHRVCVSVLTFVATTCYSHISDIDEASVRP